MCSELDDSYEWSVARMELFGDEMLLQLRPVASHITHHAHIGTLWEETKDEKSNESKSSPEGTRAGTNRRSQTSRGRLDVRRGATHEATPL